MFRLLVKEFKFLVKFHASLKEGNVVKAAGYFAEYKKYSDAAEVATQKKLDEARTILQVQTETVNKMQEALR